MRLGLVARADNTGLGTQTWEFYRHMHPSKTMVVDISALNDNPQYFDRYPGAQIVHGFPNPGDINEFLKDLDVIFVAESPYNYYLYQRAHELGVKVAVQYNYEFFDWYSYPYYPKPDLLIAPSKWHYQNIEGWATANGVLHTYLHCPVDRERIPPRIVPRLPETPKRFIHIQGKAAAHDRNGTEIVRRCNELLKDGVQVEILTQDGGRGAANYWELYENADVLVMPRRYGGNCLPVNEALSAAMPVIMPDISPNNDLLPAPWLVPAKKVGEFKPRMVIDIYEASASALADTVQGFAQMDLFEFETQQMLADGIARHISWDVMAPHYREALEGLL